MLALSPPGFSFFSDDQLGHDHLPNWAVDDPFMTSTDTATDFPGSFLQHSSFPPQVIPIVDSKHSSAAISNDLLTVKKKTHNAKERDRRKKLNVLYSSLRSMLPGIDATKKLSVPTTISHVLKYIPELQKQVVGLMQRKEEVLLKMPTPGDVTALPNDERLAATGTISARHVGDGDVFICATGSSPISEAFEKLEQEGFHVLNASSFTTAGDKVFCNLHLQVDDAQRQRMMELGISSEKLLWSYENH